MHRYVASVGMEVHAELATRSKMFCRCPVAFGGEPNTRVCPVCLGLPGALPIPNRAAIEMVQRTALALNCQIAMRSIFHRKNYFYPDLPKGYQISQYGETNPIGYRGWLDLPTGKRVRIRRVHLEEDTGKLIHLPGGGSGVDYNRAGVPLMEVVTDFPPDIQSADEAKEYLVQLRQILLYLGVCDGKMEEGSLRCEPNISVRQEGSEVYGTKTELKNLNSFRSVQLGVQFEIRRQITILEGGNRVAQETRGWNEASEESYLMRVKEEENDYRYFPDPDLSEMRFTESEVEAARATLPELPAAKARRYREDLGLSDYDVGVLISDPAKVSYFEQAMALGGDAKAVCNWLNGELAMRLNEAGLSPLDSKVTPAHLVELTGLIASGEISGKIAKEIFPEMFASGRTPSEIARERGLSQISDEGAIVSVVREVLGQNPHLVERYRSGHTNVIGFLIGQVMKESGGRANPGLVKELMTKELE
ncbi:MAG TPA: Asp-tRNA(Asn)/Glu-tRNA(Gln) amidotransferase subunit GatB [Fimbriimonadaceae bacterium]|nr:Asp-tRNA(Asn)/Glu-tRNA(Gln) amidotransferase subunit GatB [Fimbriimonadaceae bacterium]